MISLLLSHQWKAFWRSRNAGKSVAIQIFMGFLMLYLLGSALLLGFAVKAIITKLVPGQDVVTVFSGFILYYFAFDILIRFMLQELPTIAVQPYLAHNIKRKQLVQFLNWRSLFTFLNLLPLILFIPFSITGIGKAYGSLVATCFVISIISLCIFNHFLILYVKRKTVINAWWMVGFFVTVVLFMLGDYFGIFSLQKISAFLFTGILHNAWLCFVAIAFAALAFINNSNFLYNNLYIEEISKSAKAKTSNEFSWLQRFGNMGDLIAVDLKLILRNKRPRSLLMLSVIFLAYGFIFYKQAYFEKNMLGMVLMGSIIITGMFMASFGQFLFAWQSVHFDGIMASNTNIKTFIKSKFYLLTAFSTIAMLISLPYGFINWRIIPIQIAAYFFNVGIHAIICIYFATRSYKGLDLGKAATFNYQGTGAAQWLYSLSIFLIGGLLYFPLGFFVNPWAGIIAVGLLGLISFLLQDWWMDILTREFMLRKYKILEGFREK
jgi:hypothetical protein